ncbi:response regulator [Methanosphaerula palustris]|uniref:Response regulator receiver protein n=1 Tax=Methanosphaerula palustris (strain ATCC BAA-1556 / DSM 19958 / E1-9c) TaxID=521011 RepID=B8GI52_METPE|nr:response regulator [Methanosphaerula palustris]ACL16792.1 response regulator receiver protein [Methanosphaerula palustris E1-9c]
MTMISVLYIDDEPGLLEIGKLFLERIGTFTVDIVTSARDALCRLASTSYDIIVSDYQMPGMNGIELLRKIRMNSDIPFILFTGRSREEIVVKALDCGADHYVQKGGNLKAQFAELSHDIIQITLQRHIEAELKREQEFSRALLETLIIDSDDHRQVDLLPCPIIDHDPTSQRSTPGGRIPNAFGKNRRKTPSIDIQKTGKSNARFVKLSANIPSSVTDRGGRSGLFEEKVLSNTLVEDLFIGPEDLYRMEVLPSPSRGPASRFRYTGA